MYFVRLNIGAVGAMGFAGVTAVTNRRWQADKDIQAPTIGCTEGDQIQQYYLKTFHMVQSHVPKTSAFLSTRLAACTARAWRQPPLGSSTNH